MSSSGSGSVINYGSSSDFLTSYSSGSGSGSKSQKVTVPTVPVPVLQHWKHGEVGETRRLIHHHLQVVLSWVLHTDTKESEKHSEVDGTRRLVHHHLQVVLSWVLHTHQRQ